MHFEFFFENTLQQHFRINSLPTIKLQLKTLQFSSACCFSTTFLATKSLPIRISKSSALPCLLGCLSTQAYNQRPATTKKEPSFPFTLSRFVRCFIRGLIPVCVFSLHRPSLCSQNLPSSQSQPRIPPTLSIIHRSFHAVPSTFLPFTLLALLHPSMRFTCSV